MRTLLINKFLFPKGGDAISTLTTGALLSGKGHEVHYWGMKHPDNPNYPHSELFVDYVDLVHGGGSFRQIKTAFNVLYSFEAKSKLEALLEKIRPDIVHLNNFAHQISPSILHVLKKHNIPTVMTLRDYKLICPAYSMFNNGKPCEKCKNGKYYQCLLNKCTHDSRAKSLINTLEMYLHHDILHIYNNIDIIISTSKFLKKKHIEMGFRNQIVCLPNFIDTKEWQPEYRSSEKTIVYFGRLSSEKGLFTLLNAVNGSDVQLRIIGDGPIKQDLESKAANENISNVIFMKHRSGKELRKEIQNSIATVIPSTWNEPFGRTVIESFALGKPVIGANIGGIPELVKSGQTGYTFEPGNVDDLNSKIKLLIKDPDKTIKMGHNARQHVEQNNNPEKHYKELMKIYDIAVNNSD